MFVGIDVSKDHLNLHGRPFGETFAVARDREDLEALAERLRILSSALIVLEATGGFEAVVNPAQMPPSAVPRGGSALASSPTSPKQSAPSPVPLPPSRPRALAELATRSRQVVEMIGRESNRRRTARSPKLLRGIECTLGALQAARSRCVRAAPRPRDLAQGCPVIMRKSLTIPNDIIRGAKPWQAA